LKGLQTTQNSRFYAISARFKPFTNKGKTLVIQYTVKHQQKMDCGGGYIKILPADLDQKNLNGKSQYYIMFGECRQHDLTISVFYQSSSIEHIWPKP
jgi:hypothetical protein